MVKVAPALVAALLALAFVPASQAQIYNCGVVDVVFLNPDLHERASNGRVQANGDFFIQFQVIGERASEVSYIGFSFGRDDAGTTSDACTEDGDYNGNYYSGQQVQNYRADLDASDGFFINLQTALVPDGEYSAAVHAYNENDEELGRFWAPAEVKNCNDDHSGRCNEDSDDHKAQRIAHDTTMPWPIIYPGDGDFPDYEGFPDKGLSIEVAEELSSYTVLLNGVDISDELEVWDGREWDNDLRPGYGPFGIGDNEATGECQHPEFEAPNINDCSTLGVALKWTERELVTGDVLNVELVDLAGNVAKKDVHVGYGITGGISSGAYPILQWTADHVTAEVQAGTTEVFSFKIQNLGAEVGHPFSDDELQIVPEGWLFDWTPHQPVGPGEETTNEFSLQVPADAASGPQQVTVGMRYTGQGQEEVLLQQILNIEVVGGSAGNSTAEGDLDEEQESPAMAVPLLLAGLGAVMALRRRVA